MATRKLAVTRTWQSPNRLLLSLVFLGLATLWITPSSGGNEPARPNDDERVFDSVEALSRAKSQAESRVRMAHALVGDGELDRSELRQVQALYDAARADVNAGLDRLLAELETTGEYETAEPFDDVAQRAAAQVDTFIETSDKIIFGEDRGLVEAGLGMAGILARALIDVWNTRRDDSSARNDKLISRIGTLKWREFDDLQTPGDIR